MQLFFNPEIDSQSSTVLFGKEESNHLLKVLRKKIGDKIFITNGNGYLFECEITNDNPNKCLVTVIKSTFQENTKFYLHLAVAPTKMNDRYEWFLEKATEIGVHEITPIICEHSERKVIKTERFDKIIQSAMKQSLQYYLPKLNEPISFKNFLNQDFDGDLFIAHCEETDRKSFKHNIREGKKITILIGPEGDFSPKEIQLALDKKFIPVTLGNTRLRTETAAIAACHSVVITNE